MLLKHLPQLALNNRTRAIIWFLFLSLLIHLIIADLFFEYGFQRRMVNFVQEIAKTMAPREQQASMQQKTARRQGLIEAFKMLQPPKEKRKAKLVAPKGNFGWTLFDAPPSEKKRYGRQEIPTNTQGDVAVATTAHATEDVTQIQLEDSAPVSASETPVANLEQRGNEAPLSLPQEAAPFDPAYPQVAPANRQEAPWAPKLEALAQSVGGRISGEDKENRKTKARFHDLEPGEAIMPHTKNIDIAERLINKGADQPAKEITIAERIAQIDRMQSIIATGGMQSLAKPKSSPLQPTKTAVAQKGSGPRRTMVRGAALEDPATGKPRSIISLTKGFIEKFEGEDGTDLIDRDGDPSIQPDLEDMKLITYESKLFWCLQGAWNQNYKHRADLNFPEGVAYIDYTIDRSGKLVSCDLIQSTGHTGLDNAILKTFKIASPFPPFPSSFNTETYRSGQRISVHHQRFPF
ncbi:energy transducer TonB [Candidatus Dependentiae bacterium]|nr:energy transducer TonB [Candidatus Dependentiae bacterium]